MDSSITFRIDSETKNQMAVICKQLGMSTSTAFNLFANAFVRERGMPFPVTMQQPQVQYMDTKKGLEDVKKILADFAGDYRRMAE